jgi:hypothetical protein
MHKHKAQGAGGWWLVTGDASGLRAAATGKKQNAKWLGFFVFCDELDC